MIGLIIVLMKWPELGSDGDGCSAWLPNLALPQEVNPCFQAEGEEALFWEEVGDRERGGTGDGRDPRRAWAGLETPQQSPALQPGSRPLAGVPTQGALMLTCSPTPGGGRRGATMSVALSGKLQTVAEAP